MLDVLQAAAKRRSIRRFTDVPVPRAALEAIVEAARLAPTGLNRQPLRFAVASSRALCERIYLHTRWAAIIPDGSAGPDAATQPTAYIAILVDKTVAKSADTDAGAAGMSILLAAEAQGIATCWLGNIDREDILGLMGLSSDLYALHTLVALGYPAMASRAVALPADGSTKYYLEGKDSLCVPKRAAEDVIHWTE